MKAADILSNAAPDLTQRVDFMRTLLVGLSMIEDDEIRRIRNGLATELDDLRQAIERLIVAAEPAAAAPSPGDGLPPVLDAALAQVVDVLDYILEWVGELEALEIREFAGAQYDEMIEEVIGEARSFHWDGRTIDDVCRDRPVRHTVCPLSAAIEEALEEAGGADALRIEVKRFEDTALWTNPFLLRSILALLLQDLCERVQAAGLDGPVNAMVIVRATGEEVVVRLAARGRMPAALLEPGAGGLKGYFRLAEESGAGRRLAAAAYGRALGCTLDAENLGSQAVLTVRLPAVPVAKIEELGAAGLIDPRVAAEPLAYQATALAALIHRMRDGQRPIRVLYEASADGIASALLMELLLRKLWGAAFDPARWQPQAFRPEEPLPEGWQSDPGGGFLLLLGVDYVTAVERLELTPDLLLDSHDRGGPIKEIRPGDEGPPEEQRILYVSPRKRLLVEESMPAALVVRYLALALLARADATDFEEDHAWLAGLAAAAGRRTEEWAAFLARFDQERLAALATRLERVTGAGGGGAELAYAVLSRVLADARRAPLLREYLAPFSAVADTAPEAELAEIYRRDRELAERIEAIAARVVDFVYEKMPDLSKTSIDYPIRDEERRIGGHSYALAGALAGALLARAESHAAGAGLDPPALVVVAEPPSGGQLWVQARSDPWRVDCQSLLAALGAGSGDADGAWGRIPVRGDPGRSFGDFVWDVQAYLDGLRMNRAVAIDHYVGHTLGLEPGDRAFVAYDPTQREMARIFAEILKEKRIPSLLFRLDTSHGRIGLEPDCLERISRAVDRVQTDMRGRLLALALFGPRQQRDLGGRMKLHRLLADKRDPRGRAPMRAFALELSDRILLSPILQGDLPRMIERGRWVQSIFQAGRNCLLTTAAGTALIVEIESDRVHVDAAPEYVRAGYLGSLPLGQTFALVRSGPGLTVEGTVVVDVSFTGNRWLLEREHHQVRFLVREGSVVWDSVQCDAESFRDRLLRLLSTDAGASRVCAVGVGLVGGIQLNQETEWNEKRLGVGTVELGSNVNFGGSNESDVHISCVLREPTFTVGLDSGGERVFRCRPTGIEDIRR